MISRFRKIALVIKEMKNPDWFLRYKMYDRQIVLYRYTTKDSLVMKNNKKLSD